MSRRTGNDKSASLPLEEPDSNADDYEERRPGAVWVRGPSYVSSEEEEDDEDDDVESLSDAAAVGITNADTASDSHQEAGVVTTATVSAPIHATLVSDQVIVAAEVVSNNEEEITAESRFLQFLLCQQDPKTCILNEKSVLSLLDTCPEAFGQKYELLSEKLPPLHVYPLGLVCRLRPSVKLVKLVHAAYPPAISEADEVGRLPLHRACGWQASVGVVKYLFHEYPEGAMCQDRDGNMPLHRSCEWCPKSGIVNFLISQAPDAVKHQRVDGALPLHLALRNEASESTIRRLLRHFPEAASMSTEAGWIPLHTACRNNASLSIVQELLALNSEGSKKQTNEEHSLPLHVACAYSSDFAVVSALIKAFPEGPAQKDAFGRYPLNFAARSKSDLVLLGVLRAYPVLEITDSNANNCSERYYH